MGDDMNTGGGWVWAFLIIALMFGGGGFGFGGNNARPYATTEELLATVNNQSTQQGIQNVLLSSANNNYETAQLVNAQTQTLMEQNNTNLINAVQGFNSVGQQIMNQTNVLGSKLDQLGFNMEQCCCSIKTLIKDNQIADLTNQLNNANNIAVNSAQSQYLLGQMGHWEANASGTTAG